MKSYVILEVFRIEIDKIIFSRFRNGTEKISAVGKGETNNILILALQEELRIINENSIYHSFFQTGKSHFSADFHGTLCKPYDGITY